MQKNVGAALVVRGAALTIAFYRALVAHGFDRATAQKSDYGRDVEDLPRDGQNSMVVGVRRHARSRASPCSQPVCSGGPPNYSSMDVAADPGIVAFDYVRCPVAEYFKVHGEAALCVATFCQLDLPLATEWKAELVRKGSIAGGSDRYDFRWRALTATGAKP